MDLLDAMVQNYAWGDRDFIADLQRRTSDGEPEAELWMGAHPKAPSRLAASGESLDQVIAGDPSGTLGSAVAFGELPFLEKVLAAAQPLSIQTHPDAARARDGFARENDRGIPLDSPTRTYRDPNHKPELICALTPFDAKCGFRPLAQTRELVDRLSGSGVAPLRERLAQSGPDKDVLADVLGWLLTAEPDSAAAITRAVVGGGADIADGAWATEIGWSERLDSLYPNDPGVVVALLLNHFTLEPGQALFLEAGVLHAYMRGAGIEIMANSDNVIRGGLTPKHVDTVELAEVVDCTPMDPPVQNPGPVHTFDTPVPEFDLTRIVTTEGHHAQVTGPEILLATEGSFVVESADRTVEIAAGQPVWVAAEDTAWTATGSGTLFRATVPTT